MYNSLRIIYNRVVKIFFKFIGNIILFLIISSLVVLACGFFAVKYGWTNVAGNVDKDNQLYAETSSKLATISKPAVTEVAQPVVKVDIIDKRFALEQENACKVSVISGYSPQNAEVIESTAEQNDSLPLVTNMILAVTLRLKDVSGFAANSAYCESDQTGRVAGVATQSVVSTENAFLWSNGEEWQTIEAAVQKDKDLINKTAKDAGIEPRLLASALVVEQIRLYHTQRELYENVFKPLKILGTANKMAWGVMSIKEKTAIRVEDSLKDKNSPFYLGSASENLLDFTTDNPTQERYDRLVNEKDHYYSYLYASLYLKELETQWQKSGQPIDQRPEILLTLYNLGFDKSKPKADPQVGGSDLEIMGTKYTFGGLGYEFYYSGKMADAFPYTSD
jgi:hypothetical protein